jgi:fluoride exporter
VTAERSLAAEHPLALRTLVAVAVGGAVGTLLRAGVDAALPHAPGGLTLSTLLANVVGSLLLGILVGWGSARVPGWARAGLGSGLLGAFTTYSAFAVSVVQLGVGGSLLGVMASVGGTLLLSIGAAAAGCAIGRRAGR